MQAARIPSFAPTALRPVFFWLPGPAPRSVQPELLNSKPLPLIRNTPVLSSTTCPAGQPASAVLIAAVSSLPFGESVL